MTDLPSSLRRASTGLLLGGVVLVALFAARGATAPTAVAAGPTGVTALFQEQELPEGVTAAMVEAGRELYFDLGNCMTCHGEEGEGSSMGPPLVDREFVYIDGTYPSIIRIITEGIAEPVEYAFPMRPRGGEELTDEQVAAVAAYAWILTRPRTDP